MRLAEAAKPIFGETGFRIVALAALFSTASAINAALYAITNVTYQLAKVGELPAAFGKPIGHSAAYGLVLLYNQRLEEAFAVFDALGMAIGFAFALFCLGATREILGSGSLFGYATWLLQPLTSPRTRVGPTRYRYSFILGF